MQVHENYSLRKLNTFGLDVYARFFAGFDSAAVLEHLLQEKKQWRKSMILGGGSNVLFLQNYDGLVLRNMIGGINEVAEDEEHVFVKAGAGVPWHKLVMFCVDRNLGGVENLSLIPGSTGASPMQNIGAYGVEIKDVFYQLEAFDTQTGSVQIFTTEECAFGYRESVFKNKYKDRFVILQVTFRLKKRPVFNISYGAIEAELAAMGVAELSVKAISGAVINIRRSKLPDPAAIGNAGSFFKNPVINSGMFEQLKQRTKLMNIFSFPFFGNDHRTYKIPAGWLIEQCGWKGYRNGDAGCFPRQALVLVNYGQATGSEIDDLANEIQRSVYDKFGISLEREVNMIR